MMRLRIFSIIIAIVIIISGITLVMDNNVSATDRYVGANSTYKTIMDAVNASSPGDTIIVENGLYSEAVFINKADLKLMGNSTTDCIITTFHTGTSIGSDYNAGIEVQASGVQISGFNISVGGSFTFGIHVRTGSANNVKIDNNNITTTGQEGYGIFVFLADSVNVTNNRVRTTTSTNGHGIYVRQNEGNNIINNTINTTSGIGLNVFQSDSNTFMDNRVNITVGGNTAMLLSQSDGNEVINNTLEISGTTGNGMAVTGATANNITENTLRVFTPNGWGLYVNTNSDHTNITDNNITTTSATNGHAVWIRQSENCNVINNTLRTTMNAVHGVYLDLSANDCQVNNNTINSSGNFAYGVYSQNTDRTTANNNTIYTSGSVSHGIYLDFGDGMEAHGNNVTVTGSGTTGAFVTWIDHINMTNNTIITYQGNGYGIYFNMNVDNGLLFNNTIVTKGGSNAFGIYLNQNCNKHQILHNNITTLGTPTCVGMQLYGTEIDVRHNRIKTAGTTGRGILGSSFFDGNITDNTIVTDGSSASGVHLVNSEDNYIYNNTITTSGSSAPGIYILSNSHRNIVLNNTIKTSGLTGYGISLTLSDDLIISENTINTSNFNADGIWVSNLERCNVTNNIIGTDQARGIQIDGSAKGNEVKNNTIVTKGSGGYGINLQNVDHNMIKNNTINTSANNGWGIHLIGSPNNYVQDNNITTNGQNGYGIYLESNSDNTQLLNNTVVTTNSGGRGINVLNTVDNTNISENRITTTGGSSPGIFFQTSHNNKIISNIIRTTASGSRGIDIYNWSIDNRFIDNTINTTNTGSYGISLNDDAIRNMFIDNVIGTANNGATGILISQDSDHCVFINTTVHTTGPNSFGFSIDFTQNTTIIDSPIITEGPTSAGIYLDGEYARVVSSNISTTVSNDLVSTNNGNLIAIDCNFTKVESTNGVVQVRNFLAVQVYHEDGLTPMQAAEVRITDNNATYYATPGYLGSDAVTDSSGRVERLDVTDRWYYYSNTPTENTTNVSVKRTIDKTWEEVRNIVDMNTSHTEVFISTDISAPAMPTGLVVSRAPGKNDLNISWDLNTDFDISKYEVHSNRTGIWGVLYNESHPTTMVTDPDLTDGTWYFYYLVAWDDDNNPSPATTIVSFFLSDITAPAIPAGLGGASTPDDGINVTWTANLDDTVSYEVWWENPGTGQWDLVANISDPDTYFVHRDSSLVHESVHRYRLRAVDDAGNPSNFTTEIQVTHQDYQVPDAPLNLEAATNSETIITLTWDYSASDDVVWYRVYINDSGQGSGGPYSPLVEIQAVSFAAENLTADTQYYFVVAALDEANNLGPFSNEAGNRTKGLPPAKPSLDALPEYTAKAKLNVTGTAGPNLDILIYDNDKQVGTGSSDSSGNFRIEITLVEDANAIKARARNALLQLSPYSDVQTVTLDLEAPKADAGADDAITTGNYVTFNASGSTDNYGIVNYTWSFEYGARATKELYGEEAEFRFDIAGEYEVTLTVTDIVGHTGTDSLIVNVTEEVIPRPRILGTLPANNAVNVTVDTKVTISFDLAMDTDSLKDKLTISPTISFTQNWSVGNTVLILEFAENLSYNTTYTVTVGSGQSAAGGLLEGTPYSFSFTTGKAPEKPKPTPAFSITTTISGIEFKPGETVTISGSSEGFDEGTEVTLTIDGKNTTGTVASDGSWSVTVTLPEEEGQYTMTIKIGDETKTETVTIKKPVEPEEEEKEDMTQFYAGIGILILIILLVVALLFASRRRKKVVEEEEVEQESETEDEEEGEEESEEEEEEEEGDEGEVEFDEEGEEGDEVEFEEDGDGEQEPDEEREEEFDEFNDEMTDEEMDELGMPQMVACPKCGTDIEIPHSNADKVSLECHECGARGRIPNPYL